jgi:hypothetical protein
MEYITNKKVSFLAQDVLRKKQQGPNNIYKINIKETWWHLVIT